MTPADHIEQLFESLGGASDEKREQVHAALRAQARAAPEAFIEMTRQRPLDTYSSLFDLYEALGPDAAYWHDFLVEEVHRMLVATEDPANGRYPRDALEGLYTVNEPAVRASIRQALLEHAASPSARTRRLVAWLLPTYEDEDEVKLTSAVRGVLAGYTTDRDWRVRVLAQQALNEDAGHPPATHLRLFDRLRMRVSDPYHWS